ncbi:hypothetical protein P4T35_14770 [Aneurinibacillus migulanus]|nr:hypothetical protein [Aneurinibacillus migulanus]MED4727435.1 hypothetical protein [Aneurinibacillus migulanus]
MMTIGLTAEEIKERLASAFTIEEMKEAVQDIIIKNNCRIEHQLPDFLHKYLTVNEYEMDDEIEHDMQIRFY